MFTFRNLAIVGCNSSSSIIVLNATCGDKKTRGISYLRNVRFEDNSIFYNAHLVNAADASCSQLEMTGTVFRQNRCIGTHCASLGARSRLTDLRLIRNRGSRDPSLDSSIFSASADSETIATSIRAKRNQIRSFHTLNGALRLVDSHFNGNKINQTSVPLGNFKGGSVIYLDHASASISSSLFENNHASNGGSIVALTSKMTISNCTFQKNNASNGNGGAIFTAGESTIDLRTVRFSNNTSGENGGALHVENGNFSGWELIFSKNRAVKSGGAVNFYFARNISISKSDHQENTANDGGAIHVLNLSSGHITHSTFFKNSCQMFGGAIMAENSNIDLLSSVLNSNTGQIGGSLRLDKVTNCVISNSSFIENIASFSGGAFSTFRSSLMILTSSFKGNRGDLGGAMRIDSKSIISISQTICQQNHAMLGGCVSIEDSTLATISSSQFSSNSAKKVGGAVQLFENCSLSILNSTFSNNYGWNVSGAINVAISSTLYLSNVRCDDNRATLGGCISITDFSNARISNCSFKNNTAFSVGGVINMHINSTVSISNSVFSGNKANIAGGISVGTNCTALFEQINFTKNVAHNYGGGIVLHRSAMSLSSSKLDSNNAVRGGSLFAFEATFKMRNSTISNCYASNIGGAIVIASTQAKIESTQLESNHAEVDCGGIAALSASHVNSSHIIVRTNSAGDVGGGICIYYASSLLCYSCQIINNSANSGAGLYLYSNNSIPVVAQLQNSKFENNSALLYGGGIEFKSPVNRSINCSSHDITCGHIILLNTTMIDNYANTTGAAVFTTDAERVLVSCEYERKRHTNLFTKNDIRSLKPINANQLCRNWKRNKLRNNDYGGIVGTYGQKILLSITHDNEVKLTGNVESGFVLENVNSGKLLPFIDVTVLDGYGQGPALTVPRSFEASLFSPDDFFSVLHSANISVGSGSFTQIVGFATPGNYTMKFTFENEELEPVIVIIVVRECQVGEEPTNNKLACQKCDVLSYNFDPTIAGGCTTCPEHANCAGRYIVPKEGYWHRSPCHDTVKKCLIEEACKYNERQETLTDFTQNFTDCNINEAMLESYSKALCKEGYQGLLCGTCKESFGISLRFQCVKCPHNLMSVLILIGLTIYLLCASVITIRGCLPMNINKASSRSAIAQSRNTSGNSTQHSGICLEIVNSRNEESVCEEHVAHKQGANMSRSQQSSTQQESDFELTKWRATEIFKIIINFLQTTSIAATINVLWTEEIICLFETSEYLGAVTSAAISGPVDCLASSSSAVVKATLRMLLSLSLPGTVFGILASIWGFITFKEKKRIVYFWTRLLLSLISVIYISYLGLTKMAVRAFYCVHIYNSNDPSANSRQRFWAIDTSIKCYTNDHSGIIALAVIVLVVISIGFPLLSAYILVKNKEERRNRDSWIFETSGFLFRAFKERCIFWESLVMLRKACLSIVVVFSYPLGGQLQGLLAIVILLIFLHFHCTLQPYRKEFAILNHFEAGSITTSCLTFTLGLFFVHGRSSTSTRSFLSVTIIIVNALFLAFLIVAFFHSAIVHLRVALKYENIPVPEQASSWLVFKIYITYKFHEMRSEHLRTLKQRRDPNVEDNIKVQFGCGLDASEIQRYYDRLLQQWLINEDVLLEINNDIQSIINCTAENDVVVLQSRRRIIPATSITIPWNLTVTTNSRVILTCPQKGPLLIAETSMFTLRDLAIVGCNGSSSIIVLNATCREERTRGTSYLRNVRFGGNSIFDQAHLINAVDASCSLLEMTGTVFRQNRCIGTHCVSLGARSRLTDLRLIRNQGSRDPSLDSSIFSASAGSEIIATGVRAKRNQIRSFHMLNGTLSLVDSHFNGNKRNQLSVTRDNSFGGGVLFARDSLIVVSVSMFENNHALNGGSIYVLSSEISIANCTFQKNNASEGNGGSIFANENSSLNISSSMFSKNHGYFGSAIYSKLNHMLSLTNTIFLENKSSRSGGIDVLNGTASIVSCQFLSNAASKAGGALVTIAAHLSIRDTIFDQNEAQNAGACLFEENSRVLAENLQFENNTAIEGNGGSLYVSYRSGLNIKTSLFRNNHAHSDGGAICTSGESNLNLRGIQFLNNSAGDNGGAVYVILGSLFGSDAIFSNNKALKLGGAIGVFLVTTVSVLKSDFQKNMANNGGAIQFISVISGRIHHSTFFRNSVRILGGAITAQMSNIEVLSSSFDSNIGQTGGCLHLDQITNCTISNSSFYENVASFAGGTISILGSESSISHLDWNLGNIGEEIRPSYESGLLISQTLFVRNRASSGGCLQLDNVRSATISNSLFLNNTVASAGGAILLSANCKLSVINSSLSGNSAERLGGAIQVSENSTLHLSNVSSDGNEAQNGGSISIGGFSNATIFECIFTNNSVNSNGGALYLYNNSTLSISYSILSSNKARLGGGLSIRDNSTVILNHISLTRNAAYSSGGGIILHRSIMSLLSSELEFNNATYGGSLFAIGSVTTIKNSTIKNCFASQIGGAMYMSSTYSNIEMSQLELNQVKNYCGGVAAFGASTINASSVVIASNSAGDIGGGICIVNASSLLCYLCQISNNKAFSGAGLYSYSNNSILIVAQLQNSRVENNSALSHGGAIEFEDPLNKSINRSSPDVTCGHIIFLNTIVANNYANNSGAAALSTDTARILISCEYKEKQLTDFLTNRDLNSLEPIKLDQLCKSWKRNRVWNDYGDAVGTYGQEILLSIASNDEVTLVRTGDGGYVLDNVNSGKLLPAISIISVDAYGLGPAPTLPRRIQALLFSPDNFFLGEYPTNISAGFGHFSKVVGFASPGNYTMKFTFQSSAYEPVIVTVVVRECQVGEEPTIDKLACQKCDVLSYNFDPTIAGGCATCPERANCTGRYIVPKEGYWHRSPCHDTVKKCLIEEACKYNERQETLTDFTQNFTDCNINETMLESYSKALCKEGYQGLLCGTCKESFGISLRFQCLKCPHNLMSVLILIGLIIYLLCASIITIRGCLPMNTNKASSRSAIAQSRNTSRNLTRHSEICLEMVNPSNEESVCEEHVAHKQGANISCSQQSSTQQESDFELTKWRTTEIFKIMINFLQTISIASAISVQWTEEVIGLFETSEYLGAISTAATSGPIDCLASSCSTVVKAILRMLFSLFIPGIVVGILGFAWCFITFKQKKGMTYFWKRLLLSLISVVYISYLGLTKMAIRAFYCVHIYNSNDPSVNSRQRFWAIDTSIKCYTNDHSGIIALAVIVLVVISIGFPLLSTYVFIKNKEERRNRDSWIFETAGFLFRAFKERCIFWESLVMLRKACLSIVVVFSYSLGGPSQGLLAILILLISLYIHFTFQPYRKEFAILNHFEASSMSISCLTFTLGIFFTDDKCSTSTRSFLSVTIIIVNTLFLAFLIVAFFHSAIVHLRVALKYENVPVPEQASSWLVFKIYITYKVSSWCCKKK
eukprot:g394.t1